MHVCFAGFLTIGIPSVRRDNDDEYLQNTLDDLIANSRPGDHQTLVLLVFLADESPDYNAMVVGKLQTKYERYLSNGFMQIIRARPQFYPQLNALKGNFNDSYERTRWRSKQVADYAFMFAYAQNISEYYLQLEDDVISAPEYFSSIKRYVSSRGNLTWAVLDFSGLGFIGRLVRSSDLKKLSMFMLNFYDEQPVDWLMGVFMHAMAQKNRIALKPSLFQHVGTISSLKGKVQTIVDKSFRLGSGKCPYPAGNPAAQHIYSDMRPYQKFTVENFYKCNTKFWASNPEPDKIIEVLLESPQNVTRIEVTTGDAQHPSDTLRQGYLVVGQDIGYLSCANKTRVGEFENGKIVVNVDEVMPGRLIYCFVIVVAEEQANWIIFNSIKITTSRQGNLQTR